MSATDHTSDLTSENWRMNAYYKPTMSSRESEPVLNAMRDVEFSDRGAADAARTLTDEHPLTRDESLLWPLWTGTIAGCPVTITTP